MARCRGTQGANTPRAGENKFHQLDRATGTSSCFTTSSRSRSCVIFFNGASRRDCCDSNNSVLYSAVTMCVSMISCCSSSVDYSIDASTAMHMWPETRVCDTITGCTCVLDARVHACHSSKMECFPSQTSCHQTWMRHVY